MPSKTLSISNVTVFDWESFFLVTMKENLPTRPPPEVKDALLKTPEKPVLFDYSSTIEIYAHEVQYFLGLKQEYAAALKKDDIKFALLTNSKFDMSLKQMGIKQAIPNAGSVKQAVALMGLTFKPKVDAHFINPFLESTLTVLTGQVGLKVKADKPFLVKDSFSSDICGLMPIVSPMLSGGVALEFPAPTFLGMVSRVLGKKHTEITSEIESYMSELTNMVFNGSIAKVNESGYAIRPTLSTILKSAKYMSSGAGRFAIGIPLHTDFGDMTVTIRVDG